MTGVASIGVCRLALADVAGLNGADAAAVGAAFRDVFESFAVRAKLRREKLGEFARKFDARVANLASAGAPLVPPVEVPPMSQPQSDAISGVFDSTVGTSAGAPDFMTAAEFASLLSAAGLVDADADADAVEVTFCRCVGGKPRGDADFASFVTALAAVAGERRLTFFQVAAPVVDAAMRARAARGKEKEAGKKTGDGADAAEPEGRAARRRKVEPEAEKAEPEASEKHEKAEAAQTAAPPLTEEERAVWAQEFKSRDESKSGFVDVERVSFALAKLRLLEDVDVALAAPSSRRASRSWTRRARARWTWTRSSRWVARSGAQARRRRAERKAGSRAARVRLRRLPPVRRQVPSHRRRQRRDRRRLVPRAARSRGFVIARRRRVHLPTVHMSRRTPSGATRLTNAGAGVVFARAKARHPAPHSFTGGGCRTGSSSGRCR